MRRFVDPTSSNCTDFDYSDVIHEYPDYIQSCFLQSGSITTLPINNIDIVTEYESKLFPMVLPPSKSQLYNLYQYLTIVSTKKLNWMYNYEFVWCDLAYSDNRPLEFVDSNINFLYSLLHVEINDFQIMKLNSRIIEVAIRQPLDLYHKLWNREKTKWIQQHILFLSSHIQLPELIQLILNFV